MEAWAICVAVLVGLGVMSIVLWLAQVLQYERSNGATAFESISESLPQPVLIYNRIEANRRTTILYLALFAVVLLPLVLYLAEIITAYFTFSTDALGGLLRNDNIVPFLVLDGCVALAIVVVAAYLEYRYADRLLLRLVGAHAAEREEEPELWRTVENLCIGAGLPQPRVYVLESPAANAFATGISPERASLVVTRGLLTLVDRLELEGVIAHELSHIGNYDIRLNTVLAAGMRILWLPLGIAVGFFRFLFRVHWAIGAGALFPLVILMVPLWLVFTKGVSELTSDPVEALLLMSVAVLPSYIFVGAPMLGLLIRRGLTRQREFLADADAALLTRYPEGLARALAKIKGAGEFQMKARATTAHLYIVDLLPEDAPWWDRILSSHPPLEERIAQLAEMGGIAPSVLRAAEEAGAKLHSTGAEPI